MVQSNSLPIAIVSSLAYTLDEDLYWDKIRKDTAEKVVSRGILYLLIFAQYSPSLTQTDTRLGLMVRWSYGYRYLLAPEEDYRPDVESQDSPRHTLRRHQTMESDENTPLIRAYDRQSTNGESHSRRTSHSEFLPSEYEYSTTGTSPVVPSTPIVLNNNDENNDFNSITSFPPPTEHHPRPYYHRLHRFFKIACREFLEFMNMPLWAMLIAVCIALYPQLQNYLFFKRSFIRGSLIYAIQTCGDVSIPLILVILGANIANDDPPVLEDSQTEPVGDRKWSLTQRQRGIILGVATRMIIVPVTSPTLFV